MGKQRAPRHPNSEPRQKQHAALPPNPRRLAQNPLAQHRQQQQQQQQQNQDQPFPHIGMTIQKKSPYLANTTTASSMTESHLPNNNFRTNVGISSYSQSSSSNSSDQSETTLGDNKLRRSKSYVSSSSSTNNNNNSQQKLFYTSPRCELPDAQIFPTSPVKRKSLTNVDDRWKTMSEQAGSHRQDSSVLHVSRRHMTPSVLKAGVLPQVARRVRELHLRLEQAEDMLPEWLDVIADKFENLEHLVLTRDQHSPHSPDDAQPNRLRRLYILYRLPHLVSIDHVPVSESERRLARPDDPNGHRVVSKKEWYHLGDKSKKKNNNKNEHSKTSPAKQNKQKTSEFRGNQDDVRHNNRRASTDKPDRQSAQGIDKQLHVDELDDLMRYSDEENDNTYDDRLSSLAELISESVEGYELDLNMADAIERITKPKDKVSRMPKDQPASRKKAAPNKFATAKKTGKSTAHKHESLQQINGEHRPQAHEASDTDSVLEDIGTDPTTDFLDDDSTVTSIYGYGHWSGACFAPFQVCTSRQERKTDKLHVSTRNNKLQNGDKEKTTVNPNKNRKKHHQSSSDVALGTTATTKRGTVTLVDPPGTPAVPDPPSDDTKGSQLPPKSHKYSTMVDESNQKQELKQRRKLFRDSTGSASHGESTPASSSRRSHKYSKLLVKMNDKEGSDSSEDDSDMSTLSKSKAPQHKQGEAKSQLPHVTRTTVPPHKVALHPQNREKKQLNLDVNTPLEHEPKPRPSPVSQQSKPLSPKDAAQPAQKTILPQWLLQVQAEILQQHPQGATHTNKEPIKVPSLDDDEVGTMTGVSIKITDDANSGMSVATIPSVLQRQAKKFDAATKSKAQTSKASATDGQSLASRRNLAGVSIDVPPLSPDGVPHGPPPNDKPKLLHSSPSESEVKETDPEIAEKLERQLSQNISEEETKSMPETSLQKEEETDQVKAVKRKHFPLALQNIVKGGTSMDSLEGANDPEIVDMVLNKLGGLFQTPPSLGLRVKTGVKTDSRNRGSRGEVDVEKRQSVTAGATIASAAALQFPKLTPTSDKGTTSEGRVREAENLVPSPRMNTRSIEEVPCDDRENMPRFAEASVASEKRKEKLRGEQSKLTKPRSQELSSSGDGESNCSSVNPASTKASDIKSRESDSGDSSSRYKKNINELETRLDSIIQNTGRPPSSLRPTRATTRSPKMSAADQKLIAETVSKLDENLRSILELQNSPERRLSPSDIRQRRSQQKVSRPSSPEGRRHQVTVSASGITGASPLEKLETTMAGLFASIMAQMSPPRRLTSPASSNQTQLNSSKREKKRNTFFSRSTSIQANEDDSTLFVVEIEKKEVAESLSHDFQFRPLAKSRAGIVAPSVVNLVDPSVQSSVTVFRVPETQDPSVSSISALPPSTHGGFEQTAVPLVEKEAEEIESDEAAGPMEAVGDTEIQAAYGTIAAMHARNTHPNQRVQVASDVRNLQQKTGPSIIDLTDKREVASDRLGNYGEGIRAATAGGTTVIDLVDVHSVSAFKMKALPEMAPLRAPQQEQCTAGHERPQVSSQVQQPQQQKHTELLLPSLANTHRPAKDSPGTSLADISRQGSKLGMVVTLPTVFENNDTPFAESLLPIEEVDGKCVAAAAAGAAAGAEASADSAPQPSSDLAIVAGSDCPSDLIPTNKTVVSDVLVASISPKSINRPPQEILTAPAINPILAVLQAPINSSRGSSFQKWLSVSERSTNFPSEVILRGDAGSEKSTKEPCLLGELLSANPKDSSLSLLSRREGKYQPWTLDSARLPNEDASVATEDIARHDAPSLPRDTIPRLSREILALLKEREKLSSAEAMDLLPSEIVMRIDKTLSASACNVQHSPGWGNEHFSPDRQSPLSIPEDIRVMLCHFDADADAPQQRGTETDSCILNSRAALSLPQEVAILRSDAQNDVYVGDDRYAAPTTEATSASDMEHEISWFLRTRPQFQEISSHCLSAAYTADDSEQEYEMTNTYNRLPEELDLAKQRILTSSYEFQSSKGHPITEVDDRRYLAQREQDGTFRSHKQENFDGHVAGLPPSLPSKIAVQTPERNSVLPPSLPSKIEVNNEGRHGGQKSALPPSLPSQIDLPLDDGSTPTTQLTPQRGSHQESLQRPPSLPSNVIVKPVEGGVSLHIASPNRKMVSPSKSLSSPFPLQFRKRLIAKSLKVSTPQSSAGAVVPSKDDNDAGTNPVSTAQAVGKFPGSNFPQHITVDTGALSQPLANPETNTSPTSPSARLFKPVASPLLKSRVKKVVARANKDLPPHNPASERRPISSISPRSEKMNRIVQRYRQQGAARSSSILDDSNDSDSDGENDGGEGEPEVHQAVTHSDE
jgi:hypothetical protein